VVVVAFEDDLFGERLPADLAEELLSVVEMGWARVLVLYTCEFGVNPGLQADHMDASDLASAFARLDQRVVRQIWVIAHLAVGHRAFFF